MKLVLVGIGCFLLGSTIGCFIMGVIAGASKNNMCDDCLYKEFYKKEQ